MRRTEEFKLLAITLPGINDPSIAIAASRAGGIGVLDLQYLDEEQSCLSAINKLARHARNECGIKLENRSEGLADRLIANLPEKIKVIILTPADQNSLPRQIQALHDRGLKVLIEAVVLEQALAGQAAGADGIIAKGNEAGGWVGEASTFILLQQFLARTALPIWAQGGIGVHTAAACFAAGATGVVLDAQLALTRESTIPETIKTEIGRIDGSETICLGAEVGLPFRVYARHGARAVEQLQKTARELAGQATYSPDTQAVWREKVNAHVGWNSPEKCIWPLGQDAAFASRFAQQFHTVGGVIAGIRQAINSHVMSARKILPLKQGAPLAHSHGTVYPIVQGPMTRVSDRAEFASEVAEAGALPFLALALMRAPEVQQLLEQTQLTLGDRPWGVGILGFVPGDLREEQLGVVLEYRPSFALIAGGRPDQALKLEHAGIPTYLHVPSPRLLKLFIENGARRFVFEGRECGGHVGPRSSFVLWNLMIETLLDSLKADNAADYHVLFAGGIHDAVSSSAVATMAATLAERGVKIGVLLGTAYLFTKEAVASGAIRSGYQEEAIQCNQTVLLESGPGHATRCAKTPYIELFEKKKRQLSEGKNSVDEMRLALEDLNIGRLRLASKGIVRHPAYGKDILAPRFTEVGDEEQRLQGMYMIGQLAALRDSTCTIGELHREVSLKGSELLEALVEPSLPYSSTPNKEKPSNIAIIGMACLLPKAPDLKTYWQNILNKVDAITEIPKDRWDWALYFDPDPKSRDKIYSKWGGFIEDIQFDPLRYGMPPSTLPAIEPLQLLTLEVVHAALDDARYLNRPFPRDRTSVILGVGGGTADLGQQYALRSGLPRIIDPVDPALLSRLPEWTEDSFAGILLNVAAGRVANRFDLGGVNYTVDAACASSLAAVYLAVRELENGTSDMVIVGGADTVQNPFAYLCFSKTQALSPHGRCRTFDESADGIVISEGIAVLILKRLEDAERDGDRVYAVIQSVAGSSDGKDKGLTAPRPEGQVLALNRAYSKAGFSPSTVTLIEAHGTGTVAGDRAEVETLKRVFDAAAAPRQSCAIGSVKSMIGHTKCTAGVAGLIKVALALHHKVLPPTLNVEKPNTEARFFESPFFVNTEARPWIQGAGTHSRRAGVSAFGFGGTNFHTVLEEYKDNFLDSDFEAPSQCWPSELLLWAGDSREELLSQVELLERALAQGATPSLRDLAYTLWRYAGKNSALKLSVVASSIEDLRQKLGKVHSALKDPRPISLMERSGIYLTENPLGRNGKVALLFPGQGCQYADMLSELTIHFQEVREQFELADRVLAGRFPQRLSSYIFPPSRFSPDEDLACERALTQTAIAQPAIGAAAMGLFRLYQSLGIQPAIVAGHSYGEYIALCSAGVLNEAELYTLSEARGRCIMNASAQDLGTMAAVIESPERTSEALKSIEGVWVSNINGPRQTVISGTKQGVELAVKHLRSMMIQVRPLQVACAFHSQLIAAAQSPLVNLLSTVDFKPPNITVFSNTTASPYPDDPEAAAAILAEHLVKPVRFADEIENIYRDGASIFLEVGPRSTLTRLIDDILDNRPHLALASDVNDRSGIVQLCHTLGQLAAHGVSLNLDRLFYGRPARLLKLEALEQETDEKPLSPTVWLVNGGQAKPANQPALASAHKIEPINHQASTNGYDRSGQTSQMRAESKSGGLSVTTAPEIEPRSLEPSARATTIQPAPPSGIANQPVANSETDIVMLQFQKLMDRFLETQQKVMLAYLQGSSGESRRAVERSPEVTSQDNLPSATFVKQGFHIPAPAPALPVEQIPAKRESRLPDPVIAPAAEPSIPAEIPSSMQSQYASEREQLTKILLQIVSERTGYPLEMLDLDINIEADLSIDSIKQVEILGTFEQLLAPVYQLKAQQIMEALIKTKTLRGILNLMTEIVQPDEKKQPPPPPVATQQKPPTAYPLENAPGVASDIPRSVMRTVRTPPGRGRGWAIKDKTFLITDDEKGIAGSLAQELNSQGGRAITVRMNKSAGKLSSNVYTADLTDPVAVTELVHTVRQDHGPLGAIIHLLPLSEHLKFEEMNFTEWQERVRREVKSLFYLAKAAGADIRQSEGPEAGLLLATTSMGGSFGNGTRGGEKHFCPASGGVAGLVKTLSTEWPEVFSRVVHLDTGEPASLLASHLVQEITMGEGKIEVGYRGNSRLTSEPETTPLEDSAPARLTINSDNIILVTGGARGITAHLALHLAERYQPTLLIVGRSPLPDTEESPHTAELKSPKELKAVLIDSMRRSGQAITVSAVEAAYARVVQDREIRSNLAAMREAGATVHYYQADVREEKAFGQVIDDLYRSYGHLDGVIHGAGVIEDKLVEDKSVESFDRVFDTKAMSAFTLAHKLRPDVKFLVFFSSVAGCFGNRGQADYAAANEVMSKIALYLDNRWPGRVVSINWGPWENIGMASVEIQKQFADRGVQLIGLQAGKQAFDRELLYGRKGEVEVVLGGGPWETDSKKSAGFSSPLLNGASLSVGSGGAVKLVYLLDPSEDSYLQDHQIDAKPVLPAAVALELMAEVVQKAWPELHVVGIRDFRILKGIVIENGPRKICVVARPRKQTDEKSSTFEVDVEITNPEKSDLPFYRSAIQLSNRFPQPVTGKLPSLSSMREFPTPVSELYSRYLFHGPSFRCISKIRGIDDKGIVAVVASSSPRQCLTNPAGDEWLIDPVVIDAGPQLAILWARTYLNMTALPSGFETYHRYGLLTGSDLHCYFQVLPGAGDHTVRANVFFTSPDGRLLGLIEGLESTCSKSLNRLAGGTSGLVRGA